MKLYADSPARRTRQLVGDAVALVVLAASVAAGALVWSQLRGLARRTADLAGAADTSSRSLRDGVSSLSGVPLVGDRLAGLLGQVGTFTEQTSGNLHAQAHQLAVEAPLVGTAVAVAGFAVVAAVWGLGRVRWVRVASAVGGRLGPGDLDVLALAALTGTDPARLRALGPDPAARWRAGDPEVVRALAALRLRALGLRPGWDADSPVPDPPVPDPSVTDPPVTGNGAVTRDDAGFRRR